MRAMLRQFRRAPGRVISSIFALTLAVGAIGVLSIPKVSESSLHAAVGTDGLGDLVVATSPLDADQLARVAALPNVRTAEGEVVLAATVDTTDEEVRLIGLASGHELDVVQLREGRAAVGGNEVVVSPGLARPGDTLTIGGRHYDVVGVGSTLWWNDVPAVFADRDLVLPLAPDAGTNHLTVLAADDGKAELERLASEIRTVLGEQGDTFTMFPTYLPDGTTPIDADIRQVSTLIGLLGIVAAIVALTLLASTTNTLITERSREIAVMRALGGRSRALRRRLRRIALAITAVALVIGLPLGAGISYLIARMVLEKFVHLTPDFTFDWRVMAASAAGMLLGARLVAARAARRVTRLPLADALRDREGVPFGRTRLQRLAVALPSGGLASRIAARTAFRRPARSLAVVAQIATAVGAAFLVPSLASSVTAYNTKASAAWSWQTRAVARDAGLPFAADLTAGDPESETGVWVFGRTGTWDIDAYGVAPSTTMLAAPARDGRWFTAGSREAVVSAGFAHRTHIDLGSPLTVELASGPVTYTVVGVVDDFARSIYLDRDVLATDVGAPGRANVVWSHGDGSSLTLGAPADVSTAAEVAAEDTQGRNAIVVIFGAIGAIVAGVAALAVLSSMIVNLFERRHELATLQAMGASRRRVRGLIARELVAMGTLGTAAGLALGALGTRGIIASFESSNAIDIGVRDSLGAVPLLTGGTLVALLLLSRLIARGTARRPVAVTLRGAA